jgi:diguanylate cyclase (GGDEF)-like protein/PAS domain S-box-containing protein
MSKRPDGASASGDATTLMRQQPVHQIEPELQNEELARAHQEAEALKAIQASEARFKGLLKATPDALFIVDHDGWITLVNEQAERMFGYRSEELKGKRIEHLIPKRFRGNHVAARANYVAHPRLRPMEGGTELIAMRRDGREFPIEASLSYYSDGGQVSVLCMIRDISERKAAEEMIAAQCAELQQKNTLMELQQSEMVAQREQVQSANEKLARTNAELANYVHRLEDLATTDGLTELKNHRAFQERLAEECLRSQRSGAPLSLLMIDVDRFKQFNDAFGHPCGDRVLRQVAAVLQSCARQTDVVTRYGGEEFAIILAETDRANALAVAERLRGAVEAAQLAQRPITISVGVATSSSQIASPSDLVKAADEALYHSKNWGRNRCTHERDIVVAELPGNLSQPYTEILEEMMQIQADTIVSAASQIRETLANAYDAMISSWARLVDLKDQETQGHCERVTELTLRMAKAIGMNSEELLYTRWGALLHDVGKIGVPDSILLKPGPLTEEEWVVMRSHPVIAYGLLHPIPFLRPALDIPYFHHEKWDGSGYPRGLKGEDIPLAARLFALADVYDAMTNNRPYRKAWTQEKALEHILLGQSSHFDPRAVKVFLAVVNDCACGSAKPEDGL